MTLIYSYLILLTYVLSIKKIEVIVQLKIQLAWYKYIKVSTKSLQYTVLIQREKRADRIIGSLSVRERDWETPRQTERERKRKFAYLAEGTENVGDIWDTVTVQLDSIAQLSNVQIKHFI